jgi:hypothetical protein
VKEDKLIIPSAFHPGAIRLFPRCDPPRSARLKMSRAGSTPRWGDSRDKQVRDPCGSGLNPLRRIRVARPWPLVESLPRSCLLYRAGDRWLSRSPQKRAPPCRPRRLSVSCVLVVCLGSASLSVFSSRDRLRRHPPHRGGINSVAAESGVSERSLSVQWS